MRNFFHASPGSHDPRSGHLILPSTGCWGPCLYSSFIDPHDPHDPHAARSMPITSNKKLGKWAGDTNLSVSKSVPETSPIIVILILNCLNTFFIKVIGRHRRTSPHRQVQARPVQNTSATTAPSRTPPLGPRGFHG